MDETTTTQQTTVSTPTMQTQTPPPMTQNPAPQTGGMVYATFIDRFIAALIDGAIMFVVGLPFGFVQTFMTVSSNNDTTTSALASLIGLVPSVISVGYYIYFIGSSGATLGKKAMKIKVIKTDGSQVGYVGAFIREVIGKFVSTIIFGIGYLWMLWDPNKQCLHDKIASTYVVKAG